MFVKDFKEKMEYELPEMYLECLPEFCFECDSPMELSETLTGLHCSNPRCPSKVAQRLFAICNSIGVKNIGRKRAEGFVKKFGIENPLCIFTYEPEEDGELCDGVSLDTSIQIMEQFKNKKSFTLTEYVRVANLPYLQTSCVSIFGDYDDLSKAYKDIESGGVGFIQDKLDIKGGDTLSIRALKVYESLMLYKSDLFEGLNFVNIIRVNDKSNTEMTYLKAVCSDEVGYPFKTKNDFYATVNNEYKDVHVEFLQSVTKSIDYLIWAGADGKTNARYTNKVKKVEGWNEAYKKTGKGKEIPIVTATEFLGIIGKLHERGRV